jgi:hypothetical protein
MVVVVSYGCWLIGWCRSVVGRGRPPPFRRSWILVILVALVTCAMAAIAGFGVLDIAANLTLVRVPPLLSPFPRLLAVAAVVFLPQLYCYLLSLLLLLCLLPRVLTATWRATPELLPQLAPPRSCSCSV